jgi:hypothetical protein
MPIDFKAPRTVALSSAIICLLVYLRALFCDFVNFDDTIYVLNSEAIRQLDWSLVEWAFTTPMANWVPLTHISLAVDYQLWGLNPFGYHLTNILLHSANTGLVALIADGLYREKFAETGALSDRNYLYPGMLFLAALLFGIHPLRVESVAWVTERKDVLNGIFSFGSIYFYLRYVQLKKKGGGTASAFRNYLVSVILYLLSLTAKTMSVSIPLLLLVFDWYPLGRIRKIKDFGPLLVEKIPFIGLAAAASILMLSMTSKLGNLIPVALFPFGARIIASGNAIFEYTRLQLLPFGISPLHIITAPIPVSYTVKTVLVVLFTLLVLFIGRKVKWLLASWLYFIIALVPILSIFQANPMSFAAHCTYLPSVFPGIVAATLFFAAYNRFADHKLRYAQQLLIGIAVSLLVFYAAMTQFHINIWHDSGRLWTRVIEIQPFDRAYFTRALYFVDVGRYQEAAADYTTCLKFMTDDNNPEAFNLYAFRGEALAKAGRYEDAVRDFSAAIAVYPHRLYFYHRGMALKELGRATEAEADFKQAGKAKGQMFWFEKQ